MPRLRTVSSVRTPLVTELVKPREFNFKKGHKRIGGREKGTPNVITRSVREAIIAGLNAAGGPEGMIAYVTRVALEDYRLGVAMMALVCPRQADVTFRSEPVLMSVEDLDRSLIEAGLPPTKQIYGLDFKGTAGPIEEAEEAEILPAPTVSK
jgi:hypothetical protein